MRVKSQVAAAACAAVASAVSGLASLPAAGASLNVVGPCASERLRVSADHFQIDSGDNWGYLTIRNVGPACRTRGFPSLQLLDAAGRALPTHVIRDRTKPAREIVLSNGGVTHVGLTQAARYDGPLDDPRIHTCASGGRVAAVDVYLPGQRGAVRVRTRDLRDCLAGRTTVTPLGYFDAPYTLTT